MPRNARKRPKNHILKFVSTYLEPKKCSPFSAFFDVKRPFQKYLPQGEILAILGDPHLRRECTPNFAQNHKMGKKIHTCKKN